MRKKELTEGKRSTSFIGMPIYTLEQGKQIGNVKDVVYDGERSKLIAFTLEEPGLISPDRRILVFDKVESIGRDAIMIENESVLIAEKDYPEETRQLSQKGSALGKKVITHGGNILGNISDIVIDEETGRAVSFEVSGGIARDIGAGRNYVAAPEVVNIGEDAIVVPDNVEVMFTEQEPGGLAGAYGTTAALAKEYGKRASEYTQDQEISMSKGRTAGRSVRADDGTLIVSKGETITDDVIRRAVDSGKMHGVALAAGVGAATGGYEKTVSGAYGYTGERLRGSEVPRDITDDQGNVIIPRGTIIDDETLETAKNAGVMNRLASVVLGTQAKGGAESFWAEARERVSSAWSNVTESTRDAADRASRRRAESAQMNFLRGKVSASDVTDAEGTIILYEGDVITPLALDNLDRSGKLGEVKIKPEGRVLEGRMKEGEPSIHIVVEESEEHSRHKDD